MNPDLVLVDELATCPHVELNVMEDQNGALCFECERCGEIWDNS